MYTYIALSLYIYIYTSLSLYIYIHTCAYTLSLSLYIYIYMSLSLYIYIYIYIHTHTHTHTIRILLVSPRLFFRKGKGDTRICKMFDSPSMPEGEARRVLQQCRGSFPSAARKGDTGMVYSHGLHETWRIGLRSLMFTLKQQSAIVFASCPVFCKRQDP